MFHAFIAVILVLAPAVSREQDSRKHGRPRPSISRNIPGTGNPNYPQRANQVGRFK